MFVGAYGRTSVKKPVSMSRSVQKRQQEEDSLTDEEEELEEMTKEEKADKIENKDP